MANTTVGNSIGKKQKRIIYIILVSIFLSALLLLCYLIFLLVSAESHLVVLGDRIEEAIGLVAISIGAILGVPLGKSWWHTVYKNRKKGLILKVG